MTALLTSVCLVSGNVAAQEQISKAPWKTQTDGAAWGRLRKAAALRTPWERPRGHQAGGGAGTGLGSGPPRLSSAGTLLSSVSPRLTEGCPGSPLTGHDVGGQPEVRPTTAVSGSRQTWDQTKRPCSGLFPQLGCS